MKGQELKERPCYGLMKQNDVVQFYHLQFPRWLLEDARFVPVSTEAKFVYMLLFNRFQLPKLNGWINDQGEVFVIYTRRELSERLNISEKRVSAAMNELREYQLIWEKRCGRGYANQIYLASVEVSPEDAMQSAGGPLDPLPQETRTAETAGLGEGEEIKDTADKSVEKSVDKNKSTVDKKYCAVDKGEKTMDNSDPAKGVFSENEGKISAESPIHPFLNRQNGSSRTAEMEVLEPPKLPPNKIKKKEKNMNQCQCQSVSHRQTDEDARDLRRLLVQSGAHFLPEEDAGVMCHAIERLYYTQNLKLGDAVYPNEYIRQNLEKLNYYILQDAIGKITANLDRKVKNSSAYVVAVLFNAIMEAGSDLMVDPYLNFLRQNAAGGE